MRRIIGWPAGRVRILIAVCAALAAIGGVLAAPAFAGGSAAAPAATASLSSPISQSGHANKSVLLINGDRLLINGKSTAVSLAGSGFSAALTELRIAGRQYAVPDVALPYLGRGLDLSLFDVAAQPGGATLPVRITYSGRTPAAARGDDHPRGGGTATGYLTAAGRQGVRHRPDAAVRRRPRHRQLRERRAVRRRGVDLRARRRGRHGVAGRGGGQAARR